jgi:hypothetical protein
MIIVKRNKSRRRRTWKSMNTNKFLNNWKEFVASWSFNYVAQVETYALKIQQCVLRSIKIFVSWTNLFFEIKFFWNEKCAEAMTTTKRRRKEWITLHIEKIWQNYLKTSNEKKRIIARKKKIEFKQVFRIICDSSSNLWRLTRWTRIRSHKSRNTSKISNFSRRDAKSNAFEMTTNFEFKIRLLSNLFFSDIVEIDLIDMSNFNYFNVVLKSSFFITKNEIRQTIKRCKSNNVSKFDDILNRIFQTFVDKLMSHLINLFRVCVALSYHSRCFREIHINFEKVEKKRLHERQDV